MFTTRKSIRSTATGTATNRTRVIARSTLAAGLLAAASFAGASQAHADAPLAYSANLFCSNGSPTEVVTVFNTTANNAVANIVLNSSLQNSSQTTTVPANGAANLTFNISVGERIDTIVLRDENLQVVFTGYSDFVITGSGTCKRPAFDLVELTGYSLTCSDGVTHAAITLENKGDYPASIDATGSYWFATEEERDAAQQAGLISSDNETFTLAPLTNSSFALDFKAVDAILVTILNKQANVFTDGPRTPAAGEGCVSAPTTTVEETVPQDTTPPTTAGTAPQDTAPQDTAPQDTAPQDTALQDTTTTTAGTEGSADTPTTLAVPTVGAAAGDSPRALPVTGRSSLPTGIIGALMFAAGLGLVRTTRRHGA